MSTQRVNVAALSPDARHVLVRGQAHDGVDVDATAVWDLPAGRVINAGLELEALDLANCVRSMSAPRRDDVMAIRLTGPGKMIGAELTAEAGA